jgi:predicted ATPase
MSKIKIKNFGPIKEGYLENNGWLDIKKVTLFIGNQGSGKSVLAKLFSTFSWIEKALTRGVSNMKVLAQPNGKINPWKYHRLENYFHKSGTLIISEIEYEGDSYKVSFKNGQWSISENQTGNYQLPQIMYVPAERNLLSYLTNINFFRGTISESLADFLTEFNKAKTELKEPLTLPINLAEIVYNSAGDKLSVKGDNYSLAISESSSGFQSLVPLFLVSGYLAKKVSVSDINPDSKMRIEQRELFRKEVNIILENPSLTEEQKRIYITELSKKFNNTAFINIVEEPEQNLFPTSQWQMLKSLLEFNNMNTGNKLIMTTHSPYMINHLTLAVKADALKEKINTPELKERLSAIFPFNSTIKASELAIFELNEKDGTIKKLESYNGLPSDENYLNEELAESNELFAQLLEIQQAI